MSDYFADDDVEGYAEWYTPKRIDSMQQTIDLAYCVALGSPHASPFEDKGDRLRTVAKLLAKHQLSVG